MRAGFGRAAGLDHQVAGALGVGGGGDDQFLVIVEGRSRR
jgi:hypothetical protein